jgi:hypothetical protein
MMNWNGFYKLTHLSKDELKQFFLDCLDISFKAKVDYLPPESFSRQTHPDLTPEDFIKNYLGTMTHNTCVNRYVYNREAAWADKHFEVGFSTFEKPTIYLSTLRLIR